MADLIRMATSHQVSAHIRKYDGRPLSPEYIVAHFEDATRD